MALMEDHPCADCGARLGDLHRDDCPLMKAAVAKADLVPGAVNWVGALPGVRSFDDGPAEPRNSAEAMSMLLASVEWFKAYGKVVNDCISAESRKGNVTLSVSLIVTIEGVALSDVLRGRT